MAFQRTARRLPSENASARDTLPAAADRGVEGNSRLTAANGLILTVLLLIEGLTILQVRQLITTHIFVGLLLLSPVALKIASTTYRFGRYYLRSETYVRRGPPAPWLRLLGPPLIAATAAVLATGVVLLAKGPEHAGNWLFWHKATFVIWVILMTLHFLGHIVESVRITARERRRVPGQGVVGVSLRAVALVIALAVGVGIAAAFTPGNAWSNPQSSFQLHQDQ